MRIGEKLGHLDPKDPVRLKVEALLDRLDPKDAARFRNMGIKEIKREERRLTQRGKELDAELARKTKELQDLEDVVAFYEKGEIDQHHRSGEQP